MCVSLFVYLLKGRDRIETSRIERMAFPEAAHCERGAADHTVHLYRFQRVVGATRVKPALIADERAERPLVAADQSNGNAFRYLTDVQATFSPHPQTEYPVHRGVQPQ